MASAFTLYWPNFDNVTCTEVYTANGTLTLIPQILTFANDVPSLFSKTDTHNPGTRHTHPAVATFAVSVLDFISKTDAHDPGTDHPDAGQHSLHGFQGHATPRKTSAVPSHRHHQPPGYSTAGDDAPTSTGATSPARSDDPPAHGSHKRPKPTNKPYGTHKGGHIGDFIASVLGISRTANIPESKPTTRAKFGPVIVIGSHTVAPNSKDEYKIFGQTLEPGGVITVGSGPSATTMSLRTEGTSMDLIVNGKTTPLSAQQAKTADHFVNGVVSTDGAVASRTRDENSPDALETRIAEYLIGSQTIAPGSTAVVSGQKYSLVAGGSVVYVHGIPEKLPPAGADAVVTLSNGVVITKTQVEVASSRAIAYSRPKVFPTTVPEYLIGSKTLLPGSIAVVSGQTYSLASGGSVIYVNGVPKSFTLDGVMPVTTLPNGVVISEIDSGVVHSRHTSHEGASVVTTIDEVLIGGKTLLPGSTAVVSGQTYSLATGGSVIYLNGSPTVTLNEGTPVVTLSNGVVVTATEVSTTLPSSNGSTSTSGSSFVVAKGGTCFSIIASIISAFMLVLW